MNIRNKEFVCGRRLRAKLAKRAGFKSLEFKGTGHPVLKTCTAANYQIFYRGRSAWI